jgi:hypothetical protein
MVMSAHLNRVPELVGAAVAGGVVVKWIGGLGAGVVVLGGAMLGAVVVGPGASVVTGAADVLSGEGAAVVSSGATVVVASMPPRKASSGAAPASPTSRAKTAVCVRMAETGDWSAETASAEAGWWANRESKRSWIEKIRDTQLSLH